MKITYTNHVYSFHPYGTRCQTTAFAGEGESRVKITADAIGVNLSAAKNNAKRSIEIQAGWKVK